MPGLRICDVNVDGELRLNCPHEELLTLPLSVRERAKAVSNWRISGYHLHEPAAAAMFELDKFKSICSALFDRPAVPRYSLAFSKGSQQAVHQDSCVFHVWPRNYLIGIWTACEDITLDSGPLEYYPGSHREPLFVEYDNYPQTQRRTVDPEGCARYDSYVQELAAKYPRKLLTPRKGTTLFWHAMLIHGGSPVANPASTRKSLVLHYMADGADKSAEVEGPFNW